MNNVPNYLRWIFIFPVAALTFIGVQFIIAIVNSFTPLPERIVNIFCQFVNSIAGPFFFVIVGAKIAPSHKYYVGIILTAIYIIFSLLLIFLTTKSQDTADPIWWLITSIFLGVLAAIVACSLIKTGQL